MDELPHSHVPRNYGKTPDPLLDIDDKSKSFLYALWQLCQPVMTKPLSKHEKAERFAYYTMCTNTSPPYNTKGLISNT